MKKALYLTFALLCALSCCRTEHFTLREVIEVDGRQGIACDENYYYVSSSTALYKYDKTGALVQSNEDPFEGLSLPANHFGDIDVYNGEIYTGIETFLDGKGENIQVGVYDAATLEYKYSIPWNAESGQVEVCGLAVDREHDRVWMADWVQGHELYCYSLENGQYIGKVRLNPAPDLQQGIYCKNGTMIISSDDGDAEKDEADHLYAVELYPKGRDILRSDEVPTLQCVMYREMKDFKRAGEIEGLTFDDDGKTLIVLSNRGSRIILGMVRGFYPGYDREIHEIYVFSGSRGKRD